MSMQQVLSVCGQLETVHTHSILGGDILTSGGT